MLASLEGCGYRPWQPSVRLARANIATSGVEDRIELRVQSFEQLQDDRAYSIAWLPGPFLSQASSDAPALEGVKRALKPGGWLVFSLFSSPR